LALAAWGEAGLAAVVRLLDAGGESAGPGTAIERHARAMLNEIPWLTGADAERAITGPLAEFDAGAGELRDHEVMEVSRGNIPASTGELAGLVLPPPRPRASVLMGDGGPGQQQSGAKPPAPAAKAPAPKPSARSPAGK
jgi:hypothetical protein